MAICQAVPVTTWPRKLKMNHSQGQEKKLTKEMVD